MRISKVTIGVLLCLSSLILLNLNQTVIGLILFIYGIILMYGGKWPRR